MYIYICIYMYIYASIYTCIYIYLYERRGRQGVLACSHPLVPAPSFTSFFLFFFPHAFTHIHSHKRAHSHAQPLSCAHSI